MCKYVFASVLLLVISVVVYGCQSKSGGGGSGGYDPTSSQEDVGVGYDEKREILTIHFIENTAAGVRDYHNVPKRVYEELLEAPSKRRYIRDKIMGQYRERVYEQGQATPWMTMMSDRPK